MKSFFYHFLARFLDSLGLKPLPGNFQQSPMTTDKEIKDLRKFQACAMMRNEQKQRFFK